MDAPPQRLSPPPRALRLRRFLLSHVSSSLAAPRSPRDPTPRRVAARRKPRLSWRRHPLLGRLCPFSSPIPRLWCPPRSAFRPFPRFPFPAPPFPDRFAPLCRLSSGSPCAFKKKLFAPSPLPSAPFPPRLPFLPAFLPHCCCCCCCCSFLAFRLVALISLSLSHVAAPGQSLLLVAGVGGVALPGKGNARTRGRCSRGRGGGGRKPGVVASVEHRESQGSLQSREAAKAEERRRCAEPLKRREQAGAKATMEKTGRERGRAEKASGARWKG